MECRVFDDLAVEIFPTREEMGKKAANDAIVAIRTLLKQQEIVRCIFAVAPSQREFFAHLVIDPTIPWNRLWGFHMDEYIGLAADSPALFQNYLDREIWGALPQLHTEKINGLASDPQAECQRYEELLREHPLDLVFAGIGENGHIAFNDPSVADFSDPRGVKVVTLDTASRAQQVHDGSFYALDQVPKTAITVTIPALFAAKRILCMVPDGRKAPAVKKTLRGPISETCPASILRTHPNSTLYLDADSAALL